MSRVFRRFDVRDVALDARSEYAAAQWAGERYVLELDPDRLLYPFREESGVRQPACATRYPNWESMGMGGHICGHYLSALAGFWSVTGRTVFRDRVAIVLAGLAECQDAHGDGYVGGIPGSDRLFAQLRRGGDVTAQSFDLDGSWVPLYNLHKLFAGLIDCWRTFDDDSCGTLARAIVLKLARWWCALSDDMPDSAFRTMLQCEFGGMNESFADLYQLTGEQRFLREAKRFTEPDLFDKLSAGEDCLTGLHANTQIPKILGYDRIADLTGDGAYAKAVDTFWDSVVNHRSVSIGAHSVAEHFHPVGDFGSMITSRQGVETCNSYNMSKLAERRFLATGDMPYLDFYERVVENHILSTIGTHEQGFVYFTPMRPRHYRVYSSAQESFWCCVGSGLENHARYGRLVYAKVQADAGGQTDGLAVNLFVPSTLTRHEVGIQVKQRYEPGEGLQNVGALTLSDMPVLADRVGGDAQGRHGLTILIRRPWWVEDVIYTFDGGVGQIVSETSAVAGGYDRLHVHWSGTMTIHFTHTVKVTLEQLPDGSPWVSILRGPIVMAQRNGTNDLEGLRGDDSRAGHIASGPLMPMGDLPILAGDVASGAVNGNTGRVDGTVDVIVQSWDVARSQECSRRLTLEPFSAIEVDRYTVYLPWSVGGKQQVEQVRTYLRGIDEHEASDELRVRDEIQCGQQQSEVDHRYAGEHDLQGHREGVHYREALAGGWFEYHVKDWERDGSCLAISVVADDADLSYRLTINGADCVAKPRRRRDGNVLVDEYAVERGALGSGEDMSSAVRIAAGRESRGPRVVAVRLLRDAQVA